jgi:hypothetical protein
MIVARPDAVLPAIRPDRRQRWRIEAGSLGIIDYVVDESK